MTKLRNQMKRDLELKSFAEKTQKSYIRHVACYAKHYGKSPELLGENEIKDYLHFLIKDRQLSKSYVNQAYSALKFFYEVTLNKPWNMKQIPRCKKDKKLPIVLAKSEVKAIFDITNNLKHKAILMTIYSSGLRVSEAVNLKVTDIDSRNMQIHICGGKGNKDRYTLLSKVNLDILRAYFRIYRPSLWLFPGGGFNKPLTTRTVQKIFENAKMKANIQKDVSVHSLRHSFATHLLENGTDISYIQRLLGHTNIKTTSIYLHLNRVNIISIKSPLDTLEGIKNA